MSAPAVEFSHQGGRVGRTRLIRSPIERPGFGQLAAIAAAALRFWPPLYVQSILGPARYWLSPHRELSEFSIIDLRRAIRSLRYLMEVNVPGIGRRPPAPVERLLPDLLENLFWRRTTMFEHPQPPVGRADPRDERWFFINGVATNEDVARLNARLLTQLFHRPITVIQNVTLSLGVDLAECAIGKEFRTDPKLPHHLTFTEPALEATIAVLRALNDPGVKKVVLIAHSQGTIIAANVLRAAAAALGVAKAPRRRRDLVVRAARRLASELSARLDPRLREQSDRLAETLSVFIDRRDAAISRIEKLEVYTFANCADKMRWVVRRGSRVFPWIENFANQRDLVARLGVLSPFRDRPELIAIDGPVYLKTAAGGWGHLLNEHHLFDILDHLERPAEVENPYPAADPASPKVPRLYGYFRGASPR
jgi:pimeloyl-ACP methyl ester carboxylesterase